MTPKCGQQFLKSRDDRSAVRLIANDTSADASYKIPEDVTCSWADSGGPVDTLKLRSRIEPWLTALFQSEHLSLLAGSGLTHGIHSIATKEAPSGMQTTQFGIFDEEISAEVRKSAEETDRANGNFEDQVRVANDLLRGLEIIDESNDNVIKLREGLTEALRMFATSILEGERNLAKADQNQRDHAINYLVSFMLSFASRTGTRERLHLFTTNYDRYIEAGADVAGLRMIDRFVGTLTPVFRSSRLDVDLHYNPPGIRGEPRYLEGVVRFTKLHGSIDWIDYDGAIRRVGIPFGAENVTSFFKSLGSSTIDSKQLMIYPNSSKDRETTFYPYVELFRDFAAAICRPNSTLICYGYGFGDDHINRVIEDMLTIPSTHLVIISYDDPLGRITKLYEDSGKRAQLTLLIGDHLGDIQTLVDNYLPKPAIDRTTIRMAELLKNRWPGYSVESEPSTASPEDTETH